MDDPNSISAPGGGSSQRTRPDPDPGDLRWARRQRLLTLVGAVLALVALVCAVVGLADLPAGSGADGAAITAVVGCAVLLAACAVLGWAWTAQINSRRAGSGGGRSVLTVALVAHLSSYAAVLVTMYVTLEGSALAGWASRSGTLLGIAFLLAIAAQVVGGTQMLRRSGPPGTVPTYLRKLNAKVQSLR